MNLSSICLEGFGAPPRVQHPILIAGGVQRHGVTKTAHAAYVGSIIDTCSTRAEPPARTGLHAISVMRSIEIMAIDLQTGPEAPDSG
mmetsp:Transcript_35995/g.64200  ORF Transcript_35995/g.64200 Transcript_35995/m.64200 type:complete len:87 (-) Transcript_35995:116-376(-)